MNRQRYALSLIFISSLLASPAAWSQQSKSKSGERTQSINFEDELIQGDVKKPDLLYLLQKRDFNFKRLIKLRDNFLPEMNQTAEDIGRGNMGTNGSRK